MLNSFLVGRFQQAPRRSRNETARSDAGVRVSFSVICYREILKSRNAHASSRRWMVSASCSGRKRL